MPSDPAEGRDVCLDQIVMTGLWGDTRLTNTKRLISQIVLFCGSKPVRHEAPGLMVQMGPQYRFNRIIFSMHLSIDQ